VLFSISLVFSNKKRDLLIPSNVAFDDTENNTQYGVSVLNMDVITHNVTPAANTQVESTLSTAVEGASDIIPFIHQQCYVTKFSPGSDALIPGIKNIQSVFVFAPTDGVTNANELESLTWSATPATAAAQQQICYAAMHNTFSQLLPFSAFMSKHPIVQADITGLTADEIAKNTLINRIAPINAQDCVNPFITAQMTYSGKSFPMQAVMASWSTGTNSTAQDNGNTFMGDQLHYMAQLAENRVANRVFSGATDDRTYVNTMPYLYFKPTNPMPMWGADDTQLRFRITSGYANDLVSQNIYIVVNTYRLFKLLPNGNVQPIQN
jgi:hypothetical protein